MGSSAKSEQMQIRVSPKEKAFIRRQAKRAGMSVSAWVLSRLQEPAQQRFQSLMAKLHRGTGISFALAELHDLLVSLSDVEFTQAVAVPPELALSPELANQVAAMIELAAHQKETLPPPWTAQISPLEKPVFASSLMGLRLHLLTASPPPFRQRNIFVDASLGARV